MAAKLVAEEGVLKGLVLSLEEGDKWVIGRDPDAAQLLVEDPSASRKHLLARSTPKGIVVENLSDTNPAQVNEEPLSEPTLLKNGDIVTIGSGIYRFYSEDEAQITGQLDEESEETAQQSEDEDEQSFEEDSEEPQEVEKQPVEEAPEEPPSEEETPEEEPRVEKQPAEEVLEEAAEEEVASPEEEHVSLYQEEDEEKNILAEIDFDLMETGRWLLKVIGGPNTGAEFSMQPGASYLIGTDPNTCDVVFHDTSVSRQHARISIDEEEVVRIEDLNSRNKTFVDGEPLTGKQPLEMNALVTMGTTSFIVYDREGDMQTIISPLLPDIVRSLKEKEEKREREEEEKEAEATAAPAPITEEKKSEPVTNALSAFMLIGILTGLFVIVGIGTMTLFQSNPIVEEEVENQDEKLQKALAPFSEVKYSFNKQTGQLLLVGHVMTATDRNQLMYNLQSLPFIRNIDDSGIVIDEYVWQETNQVLARQSKWRGINIHAPEAGKFVLSGYLETRAQFEELSDYITANFPYLDLLDMKVVVEEDVENSVENSLQNQGIRNVTAEMVNGQLTLRGGVQPEKVAEFQRLLQDFRQIPGVRNLRNYVQAVEEAAVVNISDRYDVTGYSKRGTSINVVVNGKILSVGETLDGMTVTEIRPNMILLKKDNVIYRIDYTQ